MTQPTSLLRFDSSREAVQRGTLLMPAGVGSEFRRGTSPTPLVFSRGAGPYLYDIDGNRLIDYYLGMGPMILGHNPASVTEAVTRQLSRGILFGGQHELEYEAAQLIIDLVPCAERVRFGSSGSEVVQAAIRLARAATGRLRILKFEGHYHGWFDNVLLSTAPPIESLAPGLSAGMLGSLGQDGEAARNTVVLPWNDLDAVEDALHAEDIAGVIMEPAMCNTSAVPPADGYLEGVRRACDATGTILIFDEVITGFRLALGGASAYFDVTPDIALFAKAMGSGFPVAAIAGRAELLDRFGGAEKVVHAGTYNGGAVVMAATVATLEELRQAETQEAIRRAGTRLMTGIEDRLNDHGVPAVVQGWPSIFHVAVGITDPITDYRTSRRADSAAYVRFTTALLERGVRALERGAWFVSAAHDDDVIDATLDAIDDAIRVALVGSVHATRNTSSG